MSEPKGEIDPRSNYDVRYQAMTMAIEAVGRDHTGCDLIETAISIESYLLGENSRLAPESPEQPKDTSNEDSTEAMVESSEGMLAREGVPVPAAECVTMDLSEGVLAEAVSANGEKVVIAE